jgi:hypothetical protein
VHSGGRLTHGVLGFCVVVVSAAYPADYVEGRIEAFLAAFRDTLQVGRGAPARLRLPLPGLRARRLAATARPRRPQFTPLDPHRRLTTPCPYPPLAPPKNRRCPPTSLSATAPR